MNRSQQDAAFAALRRTCTIIQGPPGTGKTHVSVQVLRLVAKLAGASGPLLAASDSNVAVDNIASGLHQAGVQAVRVGRPEKVRGGLDEITLEALVRQTKEKKAKEEQQKDQEIGDGGKEEGEANKKDGISKTGSDKNNSKMDAGTPERKVGVSGSNGGKEESPRGNDNKEEWSTKGDWGPEGSCESGDWQGSGDTWAGPGKGWSDPWKGKGKGADATWSEPWKGKGKNCKDSWSGYE